MTGRQGVDETTYMHVRADEYRAFGSSLRLRRIELGLRQDELAMLAGVSTRFVHMLESGKPTVRLDTMMAVLGELGLSFVAVPGVGRVWCQKES